MVGSERWELASCSGRRCDVLDDGGVAFAGEGQPVPRVGVVKQDKGALDT